MADVVSTRPATSGDATFIENMLVEAVNWDPQRAGLPRNGTLATPTNRHYVEGWPRESDAGVVAEDERGRPIGAAWFRFFDANEPGYGFVADDMPEVAIGVVPEWRGRGVGKILLTALERVARRRGLRGLSLSVEIANPAASLYRRHGYREVRQAGGTYTMVLDLASGGDARSRNSA